MFFISPYISSSNWNYSPFSLGDCIHSHRWLLLAPVCFYWPGDVSRMLHICIVSMRSGLIAK